MKLAPLQLSDYWVLSFKFEANPSYDVKSKEPLEFESIQIGHDYRQLELENPKKKGTFWRVDLSIELDKAFTKNFPYTFSLLLQGRLWAHPTLVSPHLNNLVAINGPAMLFGIARELIREATSRGPYSSIIIPSTNFLPENQTKATAKTKEKRSNCDTISKDK